MSVQSLEWCLEPMRASALSVRSAWAPRGNSFLCSCLSSILTAHAHRDLYVPVCIFRAPGWTPDAQLC